MTNLLPKRQKTEKFIYSELKGGLRGICPCLELIGSAKRQSLEWERDVLIKINHFILLNR